MLTVKKYDREHAVEYAENWALRRNPLFYDFAGIGGDCTSFVSQCIFAGSCQMNYTPETGWYYLSLQDRAPAWSGVEFLFNFLTSNRGAGPFGSEVGSGELLPGDVIQLGNREGRFYHSLIVTGTRGSTYLVSAHNNDAYNRPLDSYTYYKSRFLHIEGVRREEGSSGSCFDYVNSGGQSKAF